MKRISIILLLTFLAIVPASAQKIIAIAMANTLDIGKNGIAASCKVDYDRFIKEVSIIADCLDYEFTLSSFYGFTGEECTKANLLATLSAIQPTNKDIVFFYYSGHGTHAANDNDLLPQMCMKYKSIADQDEFIALRTVREKLQGKNAKLNILMVDCCNNIFPGVMPRFLMRESNATTITDDATTMMKKLFLENSGTVILTSSKKGQTSGGTDMEGGVFSSAFWDKLEEMKKGAITPTWNALQQKTKEQVLLDTQNQQEPYADLSWLNGAAPSTGGNSPVNVTSTEHPDLANALEQLIDTRKSEWQRLSMASSIQNQYFTYDAKVITVGRNGTNIDAEDIGAYLHRLSINKRIKGLIIVSCQTNSSGKVNYMEVHEVRKE